MNYYAANATANESLPTAYVRFLHASPDASVMDVYANDQLILKGSGYRSFSDYHKARPGSFRIQFRETGQNTPILEATVRLEEDMIYTLALIGDSPHLRCEAILDTPKKPNPNQAMLRVVHLSPDTADVDMHFNNQIAATDVEYGETTEYFTLTPNTYTIQVDNAGTDHVLLTVPNAKLKAGKYYAAYLIGFSKRMPGLQLLLPLEGATYLTF